MPTIYDVAKHAGVSIATVSAVLNRSAYVSPELTQRVKAAVVELDYTVNHLAHSLQTRRTRTVGMLVPADGGPGPFFAEVVRGAEDVLRRKGYLLIVGHTYNRVEEQSRYLEAFRARLVDGVLLFQAPGEDRELDRLIEARRAVVFVGRVPKDIEADVVATDIQEGSRQAVEYLLGRGHTRIGLVTVAASMSVSEFRLEGWRAALRRKGIAANPSYVISGENSTQAGTEAALRLLELDEPPTAIFADNLLLSTGILKAFRTRGVRCPEDVEVVSSDDAEWLDVFAPALTTVVQPGYNLGMRAAEVLLQRIRYPRRPFRQLFLKPELRVRQGL